MTGRMVKDNQPALKSVVSFGGQWAFLLAAAALTAWFPLGQWRRTGWQVCGNRRPIPPAARRSLFAARDGRSPVGARTGDIPGSGTGVGACPLHMSMCAWDRILPRAPRGQLVSKCSATATVLATVFLPTPSHYTRQERIARLEEENARLAKEDAQRAEVL